jgi:hypothetical protein
MAELSKSLKVWLRKVLHLPSTGTLVGIWHLNTCEAVKCLTHFTQMLSFLVLEQKSLNRVTFESDGHFF